MTSQQLTADVWRIQTTMPGHSFGSLNSYLVRGSERLVLIDTPWGRDDVVEELCESIAATGHRVQDIDLILLTHYHEDHSGSAGILQRRHGMRVGMHAADVQALQWRAGGGERFINALRAWLVEAGVDETGSAFALEQFRQLRTLGADVRVDFDLRAGQKIDLGDRYLTAMHSPGHTAGHMAFVDHEHAALFTGDHVFLRRRANATTRPLTVQRPIAEYWRSMDRLVALGEMMILPGHEEPFWNLERRAQELSSVRHAKQSEVVRLAQGQSAWELAQQIRRRTPWGELDGNARLAATGEALGYLYEASEQGQLVRTSSATPCWSRSSAITP